MVREINVLVANAHSVQTVAMPTEKQRSSSLAISPAIILAMYLFLFSFLATGPGANSPPPPGRGRACLKLLWSSLLGQRPLWPHYY